MLTNCRRHRSGPRGTSRRRTRPHALGVGRAGRCTGSTSSATTRAVITVLARRILASAGAGARAASGIFIPPSLFPCHFLGVFPPRLHSWLLGFNFHFSPFFSYIIQQKHHLYSWLCFFCCCSLKHTHYHTHVTMIPSHRSHTHVILWGGMIFLFFFLFF